MSQFSSVAESLDLLVEPFDNSGDWQQILAARGRSGATRSSPAASTPSDPVGGGHLGRACGCCLRDRAR